MEGRAIAFKGSQRHAKASKGCEPKKKRKDPGKYSRKRAWVLLTVYLLIIAHVIHWRLSGKSMAPLEFNEATFASESGLITLGFIFMGIALVSVVIFGRFFCGWGCHILAIQDSCTWLLKKLNIKTKFIQSRFLIWVPLGVFFFMFLWTPFKRLFGFIIPELFSKPLPNFNLRFSDGTDLTSFVTTDLWRNLPGPGIAALTFLICGAVVVYFLGTRSFCAYVCPYGSLFGWVDKISFGKILLKGDCLACGKCTSVCKSGVDVMTEVRTHGKVVSQNCFKDFDCVASCPEEVLGYGFELPKSFVKKKKKFKYPFTLIEESMMALVFIFALVIFLGLPNDFAPWAGRLYGIFPLLLSATLAVLTSFIFIYTVKIIFVSKLTLHFWTLKSVRVTKFGVVFLTIAGLWWCFLIHSAIIQYHMFSAGYVVTNKNFPKSTPKENMPSLIDAENHLMKAEKWSWIGDLRIPRQRAWLALSRGDWIASTEFLKKTLLLSPNEQDTKFQLGWVLAGSGLVEQGFKNLDELEKSNSRNVKYDNAVYKGFLQLVHRQKISSALELLVLKSLNNSENIEVHQRIIDIVAGTLSRKELKLLFNNVLSKNSSHPLAKEILSELNN